MKSIFTLFVILFLTTTHLFGWVYGGFSVDESRLSASNKWTVPSTIKEQIDVINSLPIFSEVLNFFHTVPIILVNEPNEPFNGYYYDGIRKNLKEANADLWSSIPAKSIVINISDLTQITSSFSDTALLHPLLWAFADQSLPEGYNNSDLLKYAQEADNQRFYNYNWEDNYEEYGAAFFADNALIYLLGHSDAFPYQRSTLNKKQPEYYLLLKKFFGPKSDSYYSRWERFELVWTKLDSVQEIVKTVPWTVEFSSKQLL